MGTSKRYADRIDAQMNERIRQVTERPPNEPRRRRWTPPWPPIEYGPGEWLIMRDDIRRPAGIIRTVKLGPRHETFYRVVTWAPTSDKRELVGYFHTLDEADESILFIPAAAGPDGAPASSWSFTTPGTKKSPDPPHPAG